MSLFRACIHRGARQIGGSCVELECAGARLVLDLGRPLDDDLDADVPLPDTAGIDGPDDSLLGVVLSHGHPDHYGLAAQLPPSVPLYIGQAAARVLEEARFFTGAPVARPHGFLSDRESLQLGPFRLTPYLVDHSAFDAYALHVEADGRQLFYSGDLRAHGRKASLFQRLLDRPPKAHTLLLEGTRIAGRVGADGGASSEHEVEEQAFAVFRRASGAVLVFYSPQNLDRLVGLYRAAKRSDRLFVMDLYAATTTAATGRPTIPQASWEDVRVFVPQSQRVRVKQAKQFERVANVRSSRLYPEQLQELAPQLVVSCRASMLPELERNGCLRSAEAIWSLWPGYLEQPAALQLKATFDRLAIPLTVAHASGHATAADLQRLVAAIRPQRVVPIHTSAPERFVDSFDCAELHADGDWWDV